MASVVREQQRRQSSLFTDADLEHLLKSTFVEQVEFHRAIDSTNDRALELAHQGSVAAPLLVLAERQTGGRGRGTNQWWSAPGALTFSLLIKPDASRLPPRRWPQASLTVGLAVCEAIEGMLDEPAVQLKWPNDVYVRRRKVCGILIELPSIPKSGVSPNPSAPGQPEQKQPKPQPAIVIGIGINVNNSARQAPRELQSSAIALCDVAEKEFSLVDVLLRVLVQLEERLDEIDRGKDELWLRWRERCLLTNRTVHFDFGTRQVVGQCRGIDDEGALLIETEHETERCFAGVVTQF